MDWALKPSTLNTITIKKYIQEEAKMKLLLFGIILVLISNLILIYKLSNENKKLKDELKKLKKDNGEINGK